MRCILGALCLWWLSGSATALVAPQLADYLKLPGSKAAAREVGNSDHIYISASQTNELAATTAALASCQQQAAQSQRCELVWLNDQELTTGAATRSAITDQRHPLFLWRYTKGKSVLYLAGSVHLLKPSTYPLPTPLEDAFEQASNLVLEVNLQTLDQAQLQQAVQQRALLQDGTKLEEHLTPALADRLASQLRRYDIDMDSLARLKPAAVSQQLVMLRLLTLGYPNNSGVEQHFLRKLEGRTVQGLETIEQQLDLLLNQPISVQVAMLRETLDQFETAGLQMHNMVSAWLAGDDERILAEFKSQAGSSPEAAQFYEQLLDVRNIKMAEKIQRLLEVPGTHMVLVGAAHCPGRNGIVSLLSQQGLHGQRLWSDQKLPASPAP